MSDHTIDKFNSNNSRSAALEVVILAAGKGSRMKSDLPKVLHLLAGKPLLGHVLDATNLLEPKAIHVVVGHGKEQVIEHFSGHSINWVEQEQQLGTGHAVQQVMPHIDAASNVLILTADVPLIHSATLRCLVEQMQAFPLTLLTAEFADPTGLGRIIRDGDSVAGIVEQKDCTVEQAQICEINSGIMCVRAGLLADCLQQLNCNNAQQEYYLTDIVGLAYSNGNPIAAAQPQNVHEVEGINSRVQLAAVERIYQKAKVQELMEQGVTVMDPDRLDLRGDIQVGRDTVIDVNVVITGATKIGQNCSIGPNCLIGDSIIADGSHILANSVLESVTIGQQVNVGPFARLRPGTTLADQVRIGNFVETKNAQFASGAKANHLSYVGDASVGTNTNIGAGVITCNYDGAYKHQTVIGNEVFVGSDSQLVAPVEIADGATIGAGSTITSNVHENQLAISRAKQRQIDGWQRPKKN